VSSVINSENYPAHLLSEAGKDLEENTNPATHMVNPRLSDGNQRNRDCRRAGDSRPGAYGPASGAGRF